MESEGRALDEDHLDTAIADLLSEDQSEKSDPAELVLQAQSVFPELPEPEVLDEATEPKEGGLAAALLLKWAEIRGAA